MAGSIVHVMGWRSQQYGSFERFLVALARRCAAAGLDSHLVFQAPPASAAFVADVPATCHVLPPSRVPGDPRFAQGLRRILRAGAATHLHAHFGLDAVNALATARLARVPRRYATKHIVPGTSRRTLAAARHRALAAQVEVQFAVSEEVRRRLIEAGVPPAKVRTVHLGVDTTAYRPDAEARAAVRRELGVGDATRLVLSLSHLRPGKGVEHLPALAAGLRERGLDALVLAAGDGPLRASLEASAGDALRLLGVREDVPRLLAAADVCVFATTGNEGLGLAPLEAAAAAVPLVATAVSDLPELLDGAARLVPPGDVGALVRACAALLDDPGARELGLRARERVRRTLSVDRAAALHLEAYLSR